MGILLSDKMRPLQKALFESGSCYRGVTSNEDMHLHLFGSDPNTNPIYDNLVLSGRKDFA